MNTYLLTLKNKCVYTGDPIGDCFTDFYTACTAEHAEAQALNDGYYIVSIQQI